MAEVLKDSLLKGRERYNTLFALARRARPRLDGGRFQLNLANCLATVVEPYSEGEREHLVDELYPLVLELSGIELFQRSQALKLLWKDLLPSTGSFLLESPRRIAASLSNAVYNMERESGVDWRYWLSKMGDCRTCCQTFEQWLSAGLVLAWVCGMAHYRESALELARSLPKELSQELVPCWEKVAEDPWWSRRPLKGEVAEVHKLGAFLGYGGSFQQPPEVIALARDRFMVSDGESDWLLSCDGFGATLKKSGEMELEEIAGSVQVDISTDGELSWNGKTFKFPELGPVRSVAVAGSVICVSSELSHRIHVLLAN